ncbi:MAG TPA: decarboxylating 6-phosphogluconate dehydrogenase [Candidatus Saccharimonadia bacterium]|nr:decarboxylating 6-phosphogluconate dehydrogenase [Candidatus Saccharimonadia bacterium]
MKIGYIGLGKMGKNMVLRLLEQGIEVVAWNRSPEKVEEVVAAGAFGAKNVAELVSALPAPRIIWLMVPNGAPVDEMVSQLLPLLAADDLVIDGGNSQYKDSMRRGKLLSEKGVHFLDVGVSGGPSGARNGACLMIGGEKSQYERALQIFKAAAAPTAFGYMGSSGSGHFTKMVHNGIEYGMMQAIAEGAAVLKASEFHLDLVEAFRVYNTGSVIESRLVGWTQEALSEDKELSQISSTIQATGEGEWTINAAKELGIEVPVIEDSFNVRQQSATAPENFRNKVVSAMRGKFGGHDVKKK